jgi:hypothetical protein
MGRLPANLKATQSSVTVEADVVTADESGGVWGRAGGSVWAPTDADRDAFARLLVTIDRRLRPATVVFDGRKLDPATHARLYLTASSGPLVIQGATSSRLTGDDGIPATGGAWATIGGTLTYQWSSGRPLLRNEVTYGRCPSRPIRDHVGGYGCMARHMGHVPVHTSRARVNSTILTTNTGRITRMKTTSVYGIPYIEADDLVSSAPTQFRQTAEGVERSCAKSTRERPPKAYRQ